MAQLIKLSEHFTLHELTKSDCAMRFNIDNTPGEEEKSNLQILAKKLLEPIRALYSIPFTPNSTFRSEELNRKLGGAAKSQHLQGQAADIEIIGIDNKQLFNDIRHKLDYDQVILEFYEEGNPSSGWVHVSYISPEDNRKEALISFKNSERNIAYRLA